MSASRATPIPSIAIPNTRKTRVSRSRLGLGAIDPATSTDRRRRAWRELSQAITSRLAPLQPADAALLRAIFEQDLTISQVCAAAHGNTHGPTSDLESIRRRMRYRVRQLVARVLSPAFMFVLRHEQQIPPELRPVARLCVLQGQRQRDASAQLNLSLFETRRRMIALHALIEAAQRAPRHAPEPAAAPAHP